MVNRNGPLCANVQSPPVVGHAIRNLIIFFSLPPCRLSFVLEGPINCQIVCIRLDSKVTVPGDNYSWKLG